MRALRYFGVALESILAHKLRAILTMLGIIIGVAAVLTTMGIGAGAAANITSNIQRQGVNLLTVSARGGSDASKLTTKDALVLANRQMFPDLAAVVPEYSGNATLVVGDTNSDNQVIGTVAQYATVRNLELAEGRFLSDDEVTNQRRVVVLGASLAADLFAGGEAVGQQIRINSELYEVIGVLEETGGAGFGSNDERAFAPITVAQGRLFNAPRYRGDYTIASMSIQVASAERLDAAAQQVERTLRLRHGLGPDDDNDFNLVNQASLLELAGDISATLTAFLGSIGAVSLLVGGIGIMNIMLVSVTERTREIGLRKALGAQDSDIMMQFVIESLVLCTLGGAIGMGFSYGVAFLVGRIPGFPFPVVIQPQALLLALGVSTACGFLFGLYPALRATRLDPIEALRYE
jgi:putative ABC transport system permease protein